VGTRLAAARGLSIYCPVGGDMSIPYSELDFAGRTRWADVLCACSGRPDRSPE